VTIYVSLLDYIFYRVSVIVGSNDGWLDYIMWMDRLGSNRVFY